jgi:drug/metabolite transporter (DMT)-like permease
MHPLYAIIVAILWSLSSLFIKQVTLTMDPIIIWIYIQVITFITALIVGTYVWFKMPNLLDKVGHRVSNISLITISTLLGPIIAYFLLIYIIANTSNTSMVISLAYTVPLFSVIFGFLFFNQKINIYSIIGACFIIVGILIMIKA